MWHDGLLDAEHLQVIQTFLRQLPDHVGAADRDNAEQTLAGYAVDLRPDQLAKLAYQLALFDKASGRPLWLGRTKRIATADQRIILHATDRGCTRPGCDAPGYRCQVHHVDEWATGGSTNIDKLTLACPADHTLFDQGWTTRKLPNGTTEWIPPPQLPITGGTNTYHHPERLLGHNDTSPPAGADGEAA